MAHNILVEMAMKWYNQLKLMKKKSEVIEHLMLFDRVCRPDQPFT